MVEKKTKVTSPRQEKSRDPRTAAKFVEELSWLLQSYSNLDFRALQTLEPGSPVGRTLRAKNSSGNIHFLVGNLPIIFNDTQFFPANEDIVDFANGALGLDIPRW